LLTKRLWWFVKFSGSGALILSVPVRSTVPQRLVLACLSSGGGRKKRKTPMRRSIAYILVIGLLAALLASCGPSATGQQTGGTPAATSHAHTGRIAWQGFLNHDQTT